MDVLAREYGIDGYLFGNIDGDGNLEDDNGWDRELWNLLNGKANDLPERGLRRTTTTNDEQYLQKLTINPAIHVDDFGEFDNAPREPKITKPIPPHLERFFTKNGHINFTEFHYRPNPNTKFIPPSPTSPILKVYPENDQEGDSSARAEQTQDDTDDEEEEISESHAPKSVCRDQREVWLEMKVKHIISIPDRFEVPVGEDFSGHQTFLPNWSGVNVDIDSIPLFTLNNWEESILWDDSTCSDQDNDIPIQQIVKEDRPLHVDWNWDDSAIIWDDTVKTCIPTPRLFVDPQLYGVSFVPITKKNRLSTLSRLPLNLEENCLDSNIPLRKRLCSASTIVQHSPLAMKHKFVPWQMTDAMCRLYHRPRHIIPPGKYSLCFSTPALHRIEDPAQIRRNLQWCPEDLSASENLVMLIEYTEQYPPIVQNVGMASKVRNFYSQRNDEDIAVNLCDDAIGENISLPPDDPSPFLGKIRPGERMYGLENKLYKAAMFETASSVGPQWTDLLLIKTLNGNWCLRRIPRLFVVGQTLPLQKVPSPSSKSSMIYSRDRLKYYISESLRKESKILLQDVKNVFPNETDAAIRNVLKDYCDFKRKCSQAWLMLPDIELQSEADLCALTSPEAVCLNESSQASLQRLKDMGIVRFTNPYSLSEAFDALDKDERIKQILAQIEAEIQLMPWNTTATFCDVMRGRLRPSVASSEVDLNNQFAFAKTRTDTRAVKILPEEKAGRLADGSDLRKVKLEVAQQFLRNAGEPESSFMHLRRWALIDRMRDKATEMAAAGNKDPIVLKWARPFVDNSNIRQQEFDSRAQVVFDRMVEYCRGFANQTDSDLAFERELEDLFDEVAPREGENSESEARSITHKKRKKPGPPRQSKRTKITSDSVVNEQEEAQILSDMQQGQGQNNQVIPSESMGQVVGVLNKKHVSFANSNEEVVRKTCLFIGKNNTITKTIEYIRDPAQILYYKRKKRNLEQKRSNIDTTADELAVTPKRDDFFDIFVKYTEKSIEFLREVYSIPKAKQISLRDPKQKFRRGDASPVKSTAAERTWLSQCLFISLHELESCSDNPQIFDTPSVRCGKHVPKYRSYEWRRDGWKRLDNYLAFVLSKLQTRFISWTCQHCDAQGELCQERYVNLENSINNSEFRRALLALSKHLDKRLSEGSFLEPSILKTLLEKK